MYRRILVPLDGSQLAERALPVASQLARKDGGGTLILVRVTEAPFLAGTNPPESDTVLSLPMIEADHQDAVDYLDRMQHAEGLAGVSIESAVLDGPVAASILEAAQTRTADLIVLCSHGRTGVMRWALGSVAEKIARHATIPVLLVRASGGFRQIATGPAPLHALVPLDGSPLAERAVLPAAQLIQALSAPAVGEVRLLHVITPNLLARNASPREAQGMTQERAEAAVLDDAREYLAAVATRIRGEIGATVPITITSSVCLADDVAQAITNTADTGRADGHGEREGHPADCVAVATHGRSGLERWVLGSTAERVLRSSQVPLLIVPPAPAESTAAAYAS